MDHSFHYLIMAEQAMIQKELLTKIKHQNLTIGQPKILDFLLEHDGVEQKDIAQGCHIEPGTLTTLLNRMEKSDLIVRRTLHENRRSFYIFLTENGKEKALHIQQIFGEIETKAFQGFSLEEQQLFMRSLTKIYQNIAK